ncbi:hypothetical protein O181_048639 [Austropuccinia psidii MF-1]|uniref:Reverse transcriptase/retrotransposon-derived protein RNase H-like domain-containing protein n=1 Tax=Austropuccinia psidii MF-1 TaxID=1389203 RepID=A0A9Q3DT91_9BASI|nr:hypothetical protein [Austropuccinia psidii MF-1]
MSFLGFSGYYRQHLKDFAILAKSLYRICDQQTVFEMEQERIQAYEKISKALTEAPLLLIPEWNIPFKLYIDAFGDGLGASLVKSKLLTINLHKDQFVISQEKSNQQKPDMVHMLRWQIAIQEFRANMTIVHKEGNIHKNADGRIRWALANTPDNPAYEPLEAEPQIPSEGINITDIGAGFFEEVR